MGQGLVPDVIHLFCRTTVYLLSGESRSTEVGALTSDERGLAGLMQA